jgi:hypothetical protein
MNAPVYSPYFKTEYDQPEPVGKIGRGTHYSILSCAQWLDLSLNPKTGGKADIQTLAVIWDEDHDDRVIAAIEMAYLAGLLAPVRYIGERKGNLTVLVDDWLSPISKDPEYLRKWEAIANNLPDDDAWFVQVSEWNDQSSYSAIINDSFEDADSRTQNYLEMIDNLWNLGHSRP